MIDRKALLADLIKQVKAVEADLGRQLAAGEAVVAPLRKEHRKALDADPDGTPEWLKWLAPKLDQMSTDRIGQIRIGEAAGQLREEYDRARNVGRTGATWHAWIDERITQVAVAWVLGTVFVRFCEDNELIPDPYLASPDPERQAFVEARYRQYIEEDANPSYRGWLEKAFEELGRGEAGKLLFSLRNPLYQIPISHEGAKRLLEFWRERDEARSLIHNFTDPLNEDGTAGWDTRFLGDLYQDLSETSRNIYALLQTPEFVEEFILDRTMRPVAREMGRSFTTLKMIDPTCGSGHFVLGAFRRMLKMMTEQLPGQDRHEQVRTALDAVHGVDINPFAVAIARFRLLTAGMAAANLRTLSDANRYDWPIHLAIGDSLLQGFRSKFALVGKPHRDQFATFAYAIEDIHEKQHKEILEPGRYHVVVGNPPYITVDDRKLNELYREIYKTCTGNYQLTVPFAELFFGLVKSGDAGGRGYGFVGQITSNAFLKREFGKILIEDHFARRIELTEVIDSSGAYVPEHGTPTVVLIGRRRAGGMRRATIRTVRSIQGEPYTPVDEGFVWKAILAQIDSPGSISQWVSVDDLDRERYFRNHPWILTEGGLELFEHLKSLSSHRLRDRIEAIGRTTKSGCDDVYFLPNLAAVNRTKLKGFVRELAIGSNVRDFTLKDTVQICNPYSDTQNKTPIFETSDLVHRRLWTARTTLRGRRLFGETIGERGHPWYVHLECYPRKLATEIGITFAFVSTHNHFVLDQGSRLFGSTAPVIRLPEQASRREHIQLLGLLNSSTACFWLKLVSHNKESQGINEGFKAQEWERFYEFTGTKLEEFPLPVNYPTELSTALDALGHEMSAFTPATVAAASTPTLATLRAAFTNWSAVKSRMVALQEELDWQVYSIYKLLLKDLRAPGADVPGLALGERAFEIVLARRVAKGEASGEWFKRHGSAPSTEIPEHWPDSYKDIVQKRIDAIESSRAIGMIERPEYKRRWATEGWDSMQEKALRSWLLDRIESRNHWFDENDQPTIRARHQLVDMLAQDEDFTSVAELYAPRKELAAVVGDLLADEHVPFLAALRYKPAALRKRAEWEHVWDLQRLEDAAEDEPAKRRIRDSIPLPPKYTSADFLKPSYWRARGKLDVPKERFISYATRAISGVPELFGWAGWDHREQAQALATYFTSHDELSTEEITPLLAGLLELQPWLGQWHDEFHPMYGGSPAAFFDSYRKSQQGDHHLTDDNLRAWRPPVATRGGCRARPRSADGRR